MAKRESDAARPTRNPEPARPTRSGDPAPAPRRRRWIVAVLALVLIAAGVWYALNGNLAEITGEPGTNETGTGETGTGETGTGETAASPDVTAPAEPVRMQLTTDEVLEVAPVTLTESVKVTGSIAPLRQLHLSSEVTARVVSVEVRAGDRVAEGDLLVQLDAETLGNQLAQARATVEATRAQLRLARNRQDRTSSLVDRGLSPSSELEAAAAEVDQLTASLGGQETQVRTAEEAVENATVEAPFSGMISAREVDPGAFVSTGAPLVTLVDLESLEFAATVPVRYAPLIEPGQSVELNVEGLSGRSFGGEVERINPVAIEGSRMLPVYVRIANRDGRLRGGMFASGRLVLEREDGAIGIPAEAVQEDAEGTFVLKIEDGRITRQPVERARLWDNGRMAEIAEGLSPGDRIVSQPLTRLRPGATVEIVEP